MTTRHRVLTLLTALLTGAGLAVGVASPALAVTDGDLYGCPDRYYCTWPNSPHVNLAVNWKINTDSMVNCRWYYYPDSQYGHAYSQANRSGYWLEAFNGYDGGTAIIYGWAAGRYPSAMSVYWRNLSAVRRIPPGQTSC